MVKHQSGFTLIEVMLAMTLLSIMMVLLFGTLRISAQSWDAGEKKIARVEEAAVVFRFFQRHLTTARPVWQQSADGQSVVAAAKAVNAFSFQGTATSLRFVSTFPASAKRPGLQWFSIDPAEPQGVEYAVKVAIVPFFPAADGQIRPPEEELLLGHVTGFRLAYFGWDQPGQAGYWHDRWSDRKALPALVRVSIARSDESFWPEMVFALKMAELPVVTVSPPPFGGRFE